MPTEFTFIQIQNYLAYEDVRSRGHFNMFDPRARQVTGLSHEEYSFVMENFSELKAQHEAEDAHILAQADRLQDVA